MMHNETNGLGELPIEDNNEQFLISFDDFLRHQLTHCSGLRVMMRVIPSTFTNPPYQINVGLICQCRTDPTTLKLLTIQSKYI